MVKRAKKPSEQSDKKTAAPKFKAPSGRKLEELAKLAVRVKKDQTSLSGELGQKVAQSVENDGLHRKAFGVFKQAYGMEPEKCAEFVDHLLHYFEAGGINERVAQVLRLQMGDDDTVKPFPGPRAIAAE